MFRAGIALTALLALACGKGKDATVAQGSGSGSGSATVAPTPAPPALPTVNGQGYEPNPPAARISVTPTAIVVDGKQVLALEAGVLAADAVKDEKLPAVIEGLSAPSAGPRFVIAVDKAIEYRVLVQLLATLKTQGLKSYGLLAQKTGGETVMLPIELPQAQPPEPEPKRGPGSDLQRQLDEAKKGSAASADDPPSAVVVEVRDATLSPDSSLSNDIVKAKISSAYLPGMRRCVKTLAEKDATSASSFTMTFAINETGLAADAKATGVTKDAADCIVQQAAAWRFPVPKDADRKGIKVTATATFDISVDEETLRATPADMLPAEAAPAPAPRSTLGLAVSITKDVVTVWSTSGLEGTLATPRLRHPIATPDAAHHVTAVLADIAKRRPDEREIIVMADATTKMQVVAEILGAVRGTTTGTPLFPSVLLAVGFE